MCHTVQGTVRYRRQAYSGANLRPQEVQGDRTRDHCRVTLYLLACGLPDLRARKTKAWGGRERDALNARIIPCSSASQVVLSLPCMPNREFESPDPPMLIILCAPGESN